MTNIPSAEYSHAPAFAEPQANEFPQFGPNFESLLGGTGQRDVNSIPADGGPVPHHIMHDIDNMSDAELQAAVGTFVTNAPGELIPALYSGPEVQMTRAGWDAVTEFVSEEVSAVTEIVNDYVEFGPESLDLADVMTISSTSVKLANVEKLQARLGLQDSPQGQAVSIASGSVNILSQTLAGAIANPSDADWSDPGGVGGLGLLIDLAPSFESLGETLKNPTETFLRERTGTTTHVEILVDNELNMPGGIVDRGDVEGLTPEDRSAFEELIDPEVRVRETGLFNGPLLIGDYPVDETRLPPEGPPQEDDQIIPGGETPFFGSEMGDPNAPVDEPPQDEPPADDEAAPDTTEFIEEKPADPPAPRREAGGKVVEMDGGGDIIVEEDTDAPAPWYEQSISRNLVPLDGVSGVVSELYNAVVENAEEIVGERGFLDTGVMTGFTAFLEELSESIGEITPEDAGNISEIVAPLLLDLDQGQFELEQMGLTDSALYGATQVMTEVVGSVYYAGQVAQNDPTRGAELLSRIEPQVQLLGEVFGSIVDTYAETGQLNFDIKTFFDEARVLASEIYESIYELNDAVAADVDADT